MGTRCVTVASILASGNLRVLVVASLFGHRITLSLRDELSIVDTTKVTAQLVAHSLEGS